ncbi:hypothetical protein ABT160_36985 [Streptomyces sp. NPDC001941]|uniref:hypothetical protein n=1 Tax=Streptomyces sp. NPDC001941 TaxID=3154659 RepID=UPI00332CEC4F
MTAILFKTATLFAATATLAAGTVLLTAPTAGARTTAAASNACYDGAWTYRKGAGYGVLPINGGVYRTTSRCADINIKADQATSLELCYSNPSDTRTTCKDYVTAKAGQWKVMGTNFKDGTRFWFNVAAIDTLKTGSIAA